MLRISLIVPTFNRAGYLQSALETFARQSIGSGLYEVIVVDNNSTDSTKAVFDRVSKRHSSVNWVYAFEPRQGLHYARNRGILLARGDIVVFGDDDIEVSPGWLGAFLRAFDRDERVGIVGGPVSPIWEEGPPRWVFDYGTTETHPVFAILDYGPSRVLEREYVFGCNFAIRRRHAIEAGGSAPDTFPNHMLRYSGSGENMLIDRVRDMGRLVFYEAEARVAHHVSRERCTHGYFIGRHRRWGVETVYYLHNTGTPLWKIFFKLLRRSAGEAVGALRGRKYRRLYYVAVKANYVIAMWGQYVKLLTDPGLRDFTRRRNHLEEDF